DTTVQQAGIGGPAGTWSEGDSLKALGPEGREALAARLDVDALGRRANILVRSLNQAFDSLSHQRDRLAATPSIMPTKGWLTSAFMRERVHPILHLARPHEGIDVSAPMGAEIEAPAAGRVTDVKWEEGYGNMITLDHGFGLVTRFAHCSKILVARGQSVKRGQKIALVGSTGLSTGPHLHYEVWVNHKPVDPMKYVMPDAIVD
ncbi:MAG TPA: M23 family metallopeptidase, partial [Gemmatimonadales bacterium]